MLLFFHFYFYLIVICGVTFSIGYILFAILNIFQKIPDSFARLFFCMLAGAVIIVFITSLIFTTGKTISIAFIPLFIALFLEYRKSGLKIGFKKKLPGENQILSNWILVLAGSLFIFGYFFILFYRGGQFPFIMPKRDTIYYGSISYFILHTGQENVFHILNNYSNDYRGVSPYHYFDLWFNAFWANLFHINFSECLIFLVYPFFIFCYFLGICSLIRLIVRKNLYFHYVAPFIFLFAGGIIFSFYSKLPLLANIKLEGWTDYIIDFTSLKAVTIYCFFAAFVILFYVKSYRVAFIVLLFLPVCSIALLPSVVGGILMYYLLSQLFPGLNIRKESSIPLLCIIMLILIISFYSILPSPEAAKTTINFYNYFSNSISFFNWIGIKNALAISIAYSLVFILLYIFYFLLNVQAIISEEKIRNLFLLLLLISISGVVAASLNFFEVNSSELFDLPANCFANVFIVLLTAWQIENGKFLLVKLFACVLLILSMAFSILQQGQYYKLLVIAPDPGYLNKIHNAINHNHLQNGISIRSPDEYDASAREFNAPEYVKGMYIPFYLDNGLMPVSISDFSARLNSPNIYALRGIQHLWVSGIFYRFIQQEKIKHTFVNTDESQIDFMDKYHIDYGVISHKVSLSLQLQKLVTDSFSDPVTGDKFVVFKNAPVPVRK